ncbi:MAG: CPBP family intramembrane glutamic endopeptidase [Acidobacteriaceae bacterium]
MADDLSVHPSGEASLPEQHIEHGTRWVFFGRDGLRAGWSALLFVFIFIALSMLVVIGIKHLMRGHLPDPKGPQSPQVALLFELIQMSLVLLATGIMARIERHRLAVYGYAGRARLVRFLWGGVWGFIAITGLVMVLWNRHLLAFDAGHLQGFVAWKYGLMWLAVFVCTGIFEESLLRGYLQYTLTRGIGFWWGALLMSIIFGAIHGSNKGESPVGLFSAGAVGLVFCISLWYTGSLWWAIGFHAVWDWGQTFFYGTPDSGMVARGHLLSEHPSGALLWSGGPTGPEGSLYIVPLLLIMALAMWLWWRRRGATTPYNQNA